MTLRSLEDTLPNGFHDAEMGEILIDFLSRSATLKLKILTSDPDSEEKTGVLYRPLTISLSGLLAIHLSTGHMKNFEALGDRWVQIQGFGPTREEIATVPALSGTPLETTYGFFVCQWNACIYIAAETATLI